MSVPVDVETSDPLVDESLDGFVARVAAATGHSKVRSVSAAGGVIYGHRPQLATTGWDEMPELAGLLKVDVDELRLRSHPLTPDGTRRAFFGTSVPRDMLSTRVRRFSPAALRGSAHHRALWQLRLPFDIATAEVLVDRCPDPECAAVQRWRQTSGIRYCDVCATDLATATTTTIPEGALADVADAVGLVHPDPALRAASRAKLPVRFRDEDPGQVLDLVLRLMPVVDPACRWRNTERWWNNDPGILADALAGAWRLLAGFPHAVRDHMSRAMVKNDRRFSDGNGGTSIHFLKLREKAWVGPVVHAAVTELHNLMNLNGPSGAAVRAETMGLKDVCDATGIKTGLMVPLRRRGAVATVAVMRDSVIVPNYSRAEIGGIVCDMRDRRDLRSGIETLGIPLYGLEQIVAIGRLGILEHRFFATHYGCVQTTSAEFRRISGLFEAGRADAVDGAIPLPAAMRAIGGRLKPWGPIIEALIAGRLPFELIDGRRPLVDRIKVSLTDLLQVAALGFEPRRDTAPHRRAFKFSTHLTKRDAGEVLNIAPREQTALFAHIPSSSVARVEVGALLEIAVRTASLSELAARSGLSVQKIMTRAAGAGVERISGAGYPRQAMESLLGLQTGSGGDMRSDWHRAQIGFRRAMEEDSAYRS